MTGHSGLARALGAALLSGTTRLLHVHLAAVAAGVDAGSRHPGPDRVAARRLIRTLQRTAHDGPVAIAPDATSPDPGLRAMVSRVLVQRRQEEDG